MRFITWESFRFIFFVSSYKRNKSITLAPDFLNLIIMDVTTITLSSKYIGLV